MPITTTLSDDGRILYLAITDPLTPAEVQQNRIDGAAYFASVPFQVHVLIDIRALKAINPNILNPATFANVTHQNHGLMAVVGASPMIRVIANSIMGALGYRRVRFYASIAEARDWLEARAAADKRDEETRV